jgi:hypothetical protein
LEFSVLYSDILKYGTENATFWKREVASSLNKSVQYHTNMTSNPYDI